MFYGLNNFIKKILPKKLFYRSLIIVATPIILLQIIITIVFFDSLWIKANKGMTRSLVGEVQTMFDIYKQGDENYQQMILDLYNKNFDFAVTLKENEPLPKKIEERWYSPMDRSLRRELKPLKSFILGRAILTSLSINSYILFFLKVTFKPASVFFLVLKFDIDFLNFVTTGFCPVIIAISSE